VSTSAELVFYYDLGSPECYLAAERINAALPAVPEWEPVLGASLLAPEATVDRDSVTARAAALGLQPVRWPPLLPPDTRTAMLAATYAKRVGRAVAFSLAAFRQAFAGGRDLGDENTVLIAAAACEMHPAAVLKALSLRSVTDGLQAACARARVAGVAELPAIQAGALLFSGAGAVETAARELARAGNAAA
jgi:2-hydroxychromene-2-carboxylate isomerase